MSKANKISLAVKLLISIIFISSAIGKFIEPSATALSMIRLLPISPELAKVSVYILSMFEAGIAVLVWWRVPSPLVAVPIVFWAMFLLSYFKGVDCGCFGSLPFFSQISISGHFLLIISLFSGMFYLAALKERSKGTEQKNSMIKQPPGALMWLGVGAIVLAFAAFLPLPSPPSRTQAGTLSSNHYVDRTYVKAAISYQNTAIIDARSQFVFKLGHITGAINIPYNGSEMPTLIEKHSLRNKPVIVYCSSASCNVALILAEKLQNLGCKNVKVYPGGWEEWRRFHSN